MTDIDFDEYYFARIYSNKESLRVKNNAIRKCNRCTQRRWILANLSFLTLHIMGTGGMSDAEFATEIITG